MDGKGGTAQSPEINRGYSAPRGTGGTPDQLSLVEAGRGHRGFGVRMGLILAFFSAKSVHGLMLSPVIKRSAHREKLEKELSDEKFLQKENLTRTFGHVLNTDTIDKSEGHTGSNVASIGDISKTPVEDLNVKGTTQGHTEPVHMFNKRPHHAARVNMELAPGTRLFPMNGMLDLSTSDGQRADKSYAPPDHCSHDAETSNKLNGISPSMASKIPFDITRTGCYKHNIIAGREDPLRPPCDQESKRGSTGVIMADARNTSGATDALCAKISVAPKLRQSNVFVTSNNAVLEDPDYGNATTSKNQKITATDLHQKWVEMLITLSYMDMVPPSLAFKVLMPIHRVDPDLSKLPWSTILQSNESTA
ncbi:hypothetical protein U9M48_018604 [Paspalum notatum var. saurae]|uniref:Uncharacterized protein n=1 Tax=Paspalum notatum var. saurae TaxID=547442 RepID=A0AAQ3T9R0_PASNO